MCIEIWMIEGPELAIFKHFQALYGHKNEKSAPSFF